MLDLADNLTRTLHGLCEALWAAGGMPREHLSGLWTRRNLDTFGREVLGDLSNGEGMRHVHRYVHQYAPYIAGAPGIEDSLADLEWYVNRGLKLFPREAAKWITIEQACKLSGRARKTVEDWRRAGWVESIRDEYGTMYSRAGIITAAEAADVRKRAGKAQ